jgi:hypothetical protein
MKKLFFISMLLLVLMPAALVAQWSKLSTTDSTAKYIYKIVSHGSNVYAATDKGLFRSSDDGATWTNLTHSNSVTQGQDTVHTVAFYTSGITATMFISTNSKVFASTDDGVTWAQKTTGLPAGIAIGAFAQVGTRLLGSIATNTGGTVYASTDGGNSWDTSGTGIGNKRVNCFLVDGSNVYAGTGAGVYLSTDNGASWVPKIGGASTPFIFAIAKSGSTLLAGSAAGAGAFKSTDGGTTWDSSHGGLPPFSQVLGFLVVGNTVYMLQTGSGGSYSIYTSTDLSTWVPDTAGLPNGVYFPAFGINTAGTRLFAAKGFSGDIYKKDLGGAGVINVLPAGKLAVFPNPVSGILHVEGATGHEYSVFDIAGREVIKTGEAAIDVAAVPPGVYFLRISGGEGTSVVRFVKE